MNELQVKPVNFLGDTLMAAQDQKGVIWTGVKWLCNGLGLSPDQGRAQVKKIQSDEVLKEGCVKFDTGVFDPNNATLALQLDFVPLWLAKITITPTMREENPELVEKLIQYQLKAKDVLAAAFLPETKPVPQKETRNKYSETQVKADRAKAMLVNALNRKADTFLKVCTAAGVDPNYIALGFFKICQGKDVDLPELGVTVGSPTYDQKQIAEKLGILSSSGKPHAQAVGCILGELKLEESEIERVPFESHGHADTYLRYKESVLNKVAGWLEENQFPQTLYSRNKRFKVRYTRQAVGQ